MQISSSSAASSSMALQALRDLFQTSTTDKTGQTLPGSTSETGGKSPPAGPPPGPPPASMNGGGFSSDTLSALLGSQESSSSSSSSFASKVIDAADTNGDGTVSLEELAASLGADSSTLSDAFAKVDSDGDGQISSTELDAGLKTKGPPHGHGHGGPPSASEVASSLLSSADTDDTGSLSLSEIASALGKDGDDTGLTSAFSALDANGDGALASDELTSGIKALFDKQMAAYAANGDSATSTSVSLAA
jgi:Ca2+-binding EF-hand superfamily protein